MGRVGGVFAIISLKCGYVVDVILIAIDQLVIRQLVIRQFVIVPKRVYTENIMGSLSEGISSQDRFGHSPSHWYKTTIMILETVAILVLLSTLTVWSYQQSIHILVWVSMCIQGCWMQRVYCVGHESSHRKLLPNHHVLNNIIGQIFLWILLVPLSVFRKIHDFHHSANRRDVHTSALDVYVIPSDANLLQRALPHLFWYLGIFCGGWFIHSLVSIVLFLLLPVRIARRVSPAFHGWTFQDQIISWGCFLVPIAIHVCLVQWVGFALWSRCYLIPFAVFAMVYSLQLYIYHYRTTIGPKTLYHARKLTGPKWISWWLLHLNEHDTHHQQPKVVWYALPECHKPLPQEFEGNQNVQTFFQGVLQQCNGPTLVKK